MHVKKKKEISQPNTKIIKIVKPAIKHTLKACWTEIIFVRKSRLFFENIAITSDVVLFALAFFFTSLYFLLLPPWHISVHCHRFYFVLSFSSSHIILVWWEWSRGFIHRFPCFCTMLEEWIFFLYRKYKSFYLFYFFFFILFHFFFALCICFPIFILICSLVASCYFGV